MTTIACNLKTIAADSACSFGDDVSFSCIKLFRHNNSIYGTRGDNHSNLLVDWAKKDFKPKLKPDLVYRAGEADFTVLELAPDGIFIWDEFFCRIALKDKNYAVGSGAKIALYAMRVLKMTPQQAIEEAAKIDSYTDLPVDVWNLHDTEMNQTQEKT